MSILDELKQRRVVRTVIAYVVAGFVVLQAADLLISGLDAPPVLFRIVFAALLVGLPVVVGLAWVFDLRVERSSGRPAVAADGTPRLPPARWALIALAVIGAVSSAAAFMTLTSAHGSDPGRPTVTAESVLGIAVLPFQNLSTGESNAYFASGLQDELLTQLARIPSVAVRGRASVMPYAGTSKALAEIAKELGVTRIVEGTVQVIDAKLRVNVRLIDTGTGRQMWAAQYNRTLDDAFAIQSDIVQEIVAAVGVALDDSTRAAISGAPTLNPEAYRLYLQANEYRSSSLRKDVEAMQRLYERALDLDPDFALAHAGLSHAHGSMYWFKYDPTRARADRQFASAERALRLSPGLPEAHWALGMAYYWGRRDYRHALAEMDIALKGLPNNVSLISQTGYVLRRTGSWDKVTDAYALCVRLDPRSWRAYYDLGGRTLEARRKYAEAAAAFDQALVLAPFRHEIDLEKGMLFVRWKGELEPLRRVLAALPDDAETGSESLALRRAWLALWDRTPDVLLAQLQRAPAIVMDESIYYTPNALLAGWALRAKGDSLAARTSFLAALAILDSVMPSIGDTRVHVSRGLALAALGRTSQALMEADWLGKSAVYREDKFESAAAEGRAMILTEARAVNSALAEIERLMKMPSLTTVHTLSLDPRWDPVREQPRFKALLARYSNPAYSR